MDTQLEYTRYFLGVALVKSEHLRYSAIDYQPDSCAGCCTSNSEHHIPALITQDQYQVGIIDAGVTIPELFQAAPHPKLDFSANEKLRCLHGEARLRNAMLDTGGGDWLCVDLYRAEVSTRIQRHIRQIYQAHTALCDGDIYLMIRYHQRQQNHDQAERWLRKMSASKQKIFGQVRRNTSIATALDSLEAFPALWKQFQLGSFPPILSWRCHEEIGHYLRTIFLNWKSICMENYHWCDEKTTQHVEGLAPGWSVQHRSVIENLCRHNQLFYRIETTEQRNATISRLLDQKGIILSFGTFYKHSKLLENTMLGLRHLFPPRRSQPTMMTAFRSIFSADRAQAYVQYSDEDARYVDVPGPTRFEIAYLQLVLLGLRSRDAMAFPKTRQEWANMSETPDWLVRLACLASKLGFESDEIAEAHKLDPDHCRIRHHMRLERPYSKFTVVTEDFELEASRRYHRQRMFAPRKKNLNPPSIAAAVETDLPRRQNFRHLFLPSLASALRQQKTDQILTRFGHEALALCAFYDYFARIGQVNGETLATHTYPNPRLEHWPSEPSPIISTSSKYSNQRSDVSMNDQSGTFDTPVAQIQKPNASRVVNRSRLISFFELKIGQPPRVSHSCPASNGEISSVMRELRRSGRATSFLLASRNRLMITGPVAIQSRCVTQRRLNSIYYVKDEKSRRFWVGKSLTDAKRWNSYYRTEAPDLQISGSRREESQTSTL